MTKKVLGYARVSTAGQSYETQEKKLLENGCEVVYSDKATGANREREQLNRLMNDVLRSGDTLKVTKIDRLARSIIDLNKIVTELNERGVNVEFIDDNMSFLASEDASPMQTLLFNVLGSFAQFERDLIKSRTAEGRERAREAGKHLGRPARNKKDIERALKLYDEREENGHSVNDIAKLTDVPRSTIYHELRKRKNK